MPCILGCSVNSKHIWARFEGGGQLDAHPFGSVAYHLVASLPGTRTSETSQPKGVVNFGQLRFEAGIWEKRRRAVFGEFIFLVHRPRPPGRGGGGLGLVGLPEKRFERRKLA